MYKIKYLDIFNNSKELEAVEKSLRDKPGTNIFLLPSFLKIVLNTYSLRGYYLICLRGDSLSGAASFYEKPNIFGRDILESTPGGFWTKDKDSEELLINKLTELTNQQNLNGPVFKDLYKPLHTLDNPRILNKAIIELPESKEKLLGLYSKNIRRDIRTAKREGLEVTESNELGGFYQIWSQRMRDLGTPVIPFTFFKNIKRFFKDDIILLMVRKDDRYVGGAILLQFNNIFMDPYLACLSEALKYCSAPLLYHEMLYWALSHGCKVFDLGRSQSYSGNERFKLRFGAKLKPLYSYGIDKNQINSPLGKISISSWKRLPLFVTNYLGPKIRRYIPFG